ncbi:MAG: hypothetical protein L0Y80_08675 [Ignavibacteriae bacterium]|nr:hypothetical protein [Ignavibacteriota bacterium]
MVIQSLKRGFANVNKTKRMVFFAWVLNVAFGLTLALPLFDQLNDYLRTTVREDELLNGFSANWYESWKADMHGSELAQQVNYTIFGYAPFLNHTEAVLGGTVVKAAGRFFYALVVEWTFTAPDILAMLTFAYVLISTFLAGAFIGTYARDYRMSFTEFLQEGAKYFGRFFRLSLLSLLVYFVMFLWLFDWVSRGIPVWTANEPNELTPFLYYIIKNVLVLFLLALVTMCVDYAKVRIVVEDRISAMIALIAGARFAFKNFRSTFGVYLLLTLLGAGLIALYAVVEKQIPQHTYWMILLAFVLGQLYLLARMWLKASFYASQTALFQLKSGS